MADAVVVSAVRSPFGKAFRGSLTGVRPDDLAAAVVAETLRRVPALSIGDLDDIMLGCAVPSDEHGDNIARRVAVLLDRDDVPGVTVNRFCASSVQTARMAMHAIRAGEGRAFVAGGVDCVSRYVPPAKDTRNPRFDKARDRMARLSASGEVWIDPREDGELPDVYIEMGQTAENVAVTRAVSRADQDAYALLSQQRAAAAHESGFLAEEIVPVTTPEGLVVDRDDCIRADTTLDRLAGLKPVFRESGSVTAGNACPLNDGAAALVIMSSDYASSLGIEPLARIVATSATALSPETMGLGPVAAIRELLGSTGMALPDIDLVEINEAFAAQVLPCVRDLGIDLDRFNVNGGAIAIGHPFGATGARLVGTLISALRQRDQTFGIASMCVAGGQGMALLLERI